MTQDGRRTLASSLGLPSRAAKHCTINPQDCNPLQEFGMLPGMVSPFLPPLRPARLAALVVVQFEEDNKEVAISLSLCESLLIPLWCFSALLRQYTQAAYPKNVQW